MTVHRLLYRSRSLLSGSPETVDAATLGIVERARIRNEGAGVTGALLILSGTFVQALEGPLEAVGETFERICGDMRHRDLHLIEFSAASERAFPDWAMAAVTPQGELIKLCATLEAVKSGRVDSSSASATIQLMRAIVLTAGQEHGASWLTYSAA